MERSRFPVSAVDVGKFLYDPEINDAVKNAESLPHLISLLVGLLLGRAIKKPQ